MANNACVGREIDWKKVRVAESPDEEYLSDKRSLTEPEAESEKRNRKDAKASPRGVCHLPWKKFKVKLPEEGGEKRGWAEVRRLVRAWREDLRKYASDNSPVKCRKKQKRDEESSPENVTSAGRSDVRVPQRCRLKNKRKAEQKFWTGWAEMNSSGDFSHFEGKCRAGFAWCWHSFYPNTCSKELYRPGQRKSSQQCEKS